VSQRNLVYESLVLRARESPGGSRILTLMTAEAGLVDVFVFSGPKSKLRSLASPYAAGRAFVYLDPVKDFQKLNDFDVRDSFPALREDLGRIWAAGLVAELLVKTSGGGGDFPLVLELALDTFRALDGSPSGAPDGGSDGPLLLFLWRLLNLLGIGPDPTTCAICGAELRPSREGPNYIGAYSFSQELFLCPSCAAGADRCLELGSGVLRWLSRSLELSFEAASRLPLLTQTIDTLKSLLFGLARSAAESPLASLGSGAIAPQGRSPQGRSP
jgi:DNA repair protein RecO (recombination protein O)